MLRKMTAGLAFAVVACASVSAQAAPTVYTNAASFAAANPGASAYGFSFTSQMLLGPSYSLGPVTFSTAGDLESFPDNAYGGNIPYLSDDNHRFGGLQETITSMGNALGLTLGSYFGSDTVTYTVNGVSGTLSLAGSPTTTFIGFSDGGPISLVFTEPASQELDVIGFSATSAAVSAAPEPGAWVLMLGGVALLGAALRIRKARRHEDTVVAIATA